MRRGMRVLWNPLTYFIKMLQEPLNRQILKAFSKPEGLKIQILSFISFWVVSKKFENFSKYRKIFENAWKWHKASFKPDSGLHVQS